MGYKFVVLQVRGRELPIIFPDILVHEDVAQAVSQVVTCQFRCAARAVSAGDIEGLDIDSAEGKSTTLRLSARPGDTELIRAFPYEHGIIG